jgi:hypothetical protein
MSDSQETTKKIVAAKEAGYRLILVGVSTPVPIAIHRAMSRAKLTRRFAHPDFLAPSATGFAKNFDSYYPHFESVMLFSNAVDQADPFLIAERVGKDSLLEELDSALLNDFRRSGRPT